MSVYLDLWAYRNRRRLKRWQATQLPPEPVVPTPSFMFATRYTNPQSFKAHDFLVEVLLEASKHVNLQAFGNHNFGALIVADLFANAQDFGDHEFSHRYLAALWANLQSFKAARFSASYTATKLVNLQAYGTHELVHSYAATLFQNAQAYGAQPEEDTLAFTLFTNLQDRRHKWSTPTPQRSSRTPRRSAPTLSCPWPTAGSPRLVISASPRPATSGSHKGNPDG